jgi:hypothetical protein
MKEATELNEDMLEEAEHLALLEPEDDGKEVNHITTPLVPLGPLNTTPTPSLCQVHSSKSPTS